jgi:hypothetical protein
LDTLPREDLIRFVKKQVTNLRDTQKRLADAQKELIDARKLTNGHAEQVRCIVVDIEADFLKFKLDLN